MKIKKDILDLIFHIEKKDIDRDRKVRISECDSRELCLKVARILKERFGYKDIKIIKGGGLTTSYENPGGIVIAM